MPRFRLNKFFVLLAAILAVCLPSRAEKESEPAKLLHIGPSHLDSFERCVKSVYKKPVLTGVYPESALDPCPRSVEALSSVLKSQGIRLFDAGEFIYLIASKYFPPRPPDLSPYQKTLTWNKINITSEIRPSPDISPALSYEIGKQALGHARLIPLEVSLLPASSNEINIKINVYVLVGRVAPNGGTPVLAWINEIGMGWTGRLVFGELRGSTYTMIWDSPLFNSHGQVYFKDVNRDGWLEIVIQSQDCGVSDCGDEIVIFDKDGREITRQKECSQPSLEHGDYDEEDGVCPIFGHTVDLVNGADGKSAISVTDWDDKHYIYQLQGGIYTNGAPVGSNHTIAP